MGRRIIALSIFIFCSTWANSKLNFIEDTAIFDESSSSSSSSSDIDPDVNRSFEEIVEAHDYPLETHKVITSDGYILKIFRINGKKGTKTTLTGQPALLFGHGLGDSSDLSVANSEELSLAFIAANFNIDTWLINTRGNKHSRNHTTLDPKKKEFWAYSYHEKGLIDVPEVITYIKSVTLKEKVIYLGHSQGCSQIFVLCSLKPDFCKANVSGIIALAPAVYIDHQTSAFLTKAVNTRLDLLLPTLGIYHLFDSREDINGTSKTLCLFNKSFCDGAQDLISNEHPEDDNRERYDVYYSHYPAGFSSEELRQFGAVIRQKEFLYYKDLKKYPLENVNVSVDLYGGKHDGLVPEADYLRLKDKLSINGSLKTFHNLNNFSHSTFLMSNGQEDYPNKLRESFNRYKS